MRARIQRWWVTPILVPRWMLTAMYFGFVLVGAFAAIAGVPSLSLTTWPGYVTPWAIFVTLSAIAAVVGSLDVTLEKVERWAALTLASLLTVYATAAIVLAASGGPQAAGRAAFAVVVVITSMLPAVRAGQLITRTGIKT